MKTLDILTNVDKARIMFDLFNDEIPAFLEYTQEMADKVANEEEELKTKWDNPFISYHQWRLLADEVKSLIKRYGKTVEKSGELFAEQLFGGYLAIFSNHCIEQFSKNKAQSPKYKQAVALFYLSDDYSE